MSRPAERPRPDLGDGSWLEAAALGPQPLAVRRVEPSPCTTACPAGVNVKAYVSLIAEGRFAEALTVVRERCPLPGICGRICHHPCEAACRRDQPIAIRALKRFVADVADGPPPAPAPAPVAHPTTQVAVVGSGPAGLTAAWELRRSGYPVTVFEAESEPGGMLRYGIAPYRLPRPALDAEIDYLLASGIELRTGCRIGEDLELEALLASGFASVLFALGAQRGRSLGLPDEGGEVEDALSFLRRVNAGDRRPLTGGVLVIGGGSTAVEAARTARRLGADPVTILYRRSRRELLAGDEEIEACAREGIAIRFLVTPHAVVRDDDRFIGLECLQVELGEADASGRRRPVPVAGSEFLVEADRVLAAVGQQADLGLLPEKHLARLAPRGRLQVDVETAMTALQGVFAAGDVVTGPSTVIDAVAAGQRAAATVRRYLASGRTTRPLAPPPAPAEYALPDLPAAPAARRHPPTAPLEPGREFAETERAFGPHEAVAEARRCLRCGPCSECRLCVSSCGRRHLAMRVPEAGPAWPSLVRCSGPTAAAVARSAPAGGRLVAAGGAAAAAVELLPLPVRVLDEQCRACADCLAVCPFDALELAGDGRPVRVAESRCRGCLLCAAVCPTGALVSELGSAAWWQERLESVAARAASSPPRVTVTCAGRPAHWSRATRPGRRDELVTVRCAGSIDPGRLLELVWRGAEKVVVVGCGAEGCRFAGGAALAARHVATARSLLAAIGFDPDRVVYDGGGQAASPLWPVPVGRAAAPRPRPGAGR